MIFLLYPMFAIGYLLDGTQEFTQKTVFILIGLGLAVAVGLFLNLWILVTTQLEKEALDSRILALAQKADETPRSAPFSTPATPGLRTQRGRPYPDPSKSNPTWKPR